MPRLLGTPDVVTENIKAAKLRRLYILWLLVSTGHDYRINKCCSTGVDKSFSRARRYCMLTLGLSGMPLFLRPMMTMMYGIQQIYTHLISANSDTDFKYVYRKCATLTQASRWLSAIAGLRSSSLFPATKRSSPTCRLMSIVSTFQSVVITVH